MFPVMTMLQRAWAAWRLPPWPLHPYAAMSRAYRIWIATAYPLLLVAVALAWAFLDIAQLPVDASLLVVVCLVTFASTVVLSRESTIVGVSTDLLLCLPLLFSGHTIEALVAGCLFHVLMPSRKPVPIHHVLMNVTNVVTLLTGAAVIFHAAAGTANPMSLRWLTWIAVSYLLIQSYYLVGFVPTLVLGSYSTWSTELRAYIRDTGSELTTFVPLIALVAAALYGRSPLLAAFLAVPMLLTMQVLSQKDQLVDVIVLAERDPLTGCLNRRALFDRLELHAPVTLRDDGKQSWFIFCDLDNFKQLNDTYGHDAGDEALCVVADEFGSSVRELDICARLGGEEFVVVIQRAGREEAGLIAERIRRNVERRLGSMGTTVSIGVHGWLATDTVATALNAADIAMYESKTSGKNRVTFSGEGAQAPSRAA